MAAPANASFASIVWDDVRRSCTITARATGAAKIRVAAGYAPNNYSIANQVTTGDTGVLTLKDLNHGGGQVLYLWAIPLATDDTAFGPQEIFTSIPIPNPILGVKSYPCDSGRDSEYIVDIIEHKTNNTCTPRWQNGDRVVKKKPC